MSKLYLVTGGTGFIGSALVRRLVQSGQRVRVLDNQSRGSAKRLNDVADQIEFVEADIRDPNVVERAVTGVDSVLHLAFINGTEFFYTRPALVLEVGVKGMLNVLDACLKHNVSELIVASSSEVYQTPSVVPTPESVPLSVPDPLNPRYSYGGGKIISELLALNYGRTMFERVVIFRPHNVYGPDMGWEHVLPQFIVRMRQLIETSQEGPLPFKIQGSGQETRAFVYIDDFIDGLMLLVERGEHLNIYHIGTQEEVSINRVAELVGNYFGRKVNVLTGELAVGGTVRRCPDIGKLAGLGYQPRFTLEQGLQPTALWYSENYRLAPPMSGS